MIGGKFRGRRLLSLDGFATRPMLGRMRQTMFDILQADVAGCRFADLYAGTGAVGIEALSRGASSAVFVESNGRAADVIRKNLAAIGADDQAWVRISRVENALAGVQAEIYFLGPPYEAVKEYSETLRTLSARPAEWVIAQHDKQVELADSYGQLERQRVARVGSHRLSLYRHAEPPQAL